MDTSYQYVVIAESLKLLSLPYEDQKTFFPEFVDVPFEIIDTFHKAVMISLPDLIESGRLENKAIANLLRVKNFIDFTTSNPEFKDLEEEQFSMAIEWNTVRKMARETLNIMGEPLENPNPKYI